MPDLPIQRTPTPWRAVRILILGAAQIATLLAMDWWLDGVRIDRLGTALLAVVVLSGLNALVWPLVIRFTIKLVLLTVGLFTFVLNALFVIATAELVSGFEVDSLFDAFLVALAMTATNLFIGGIMSIDDDHLWRQVVVRRLVARRETLISTTEPGMLFIQIDGLGHDVLEEAMDQGMAPTLALLTQHGTHKLIPWECDLSSQTGAMQAGILLGNNDNMPAFRWYEKESGEVLVSNRPRDAAAIEAKQSHGDGLLVDGGASRANVFSGDAPDSMFTFSTVLNGQDKNDRFIYAIATPFALLRIILLTVVDIGRELRAARRAKRAKTEPSMHRGGVYPLLRAATTVVLAELTFAILLSDIARGVPSAYVDLVGYDEVAHHSGIRAPEALDTLKRTDDQLRRLLTTLDEAPRPYHVVVLSDHGQTQGSTFLQRYGESLDAVVQRLSREAHVAAPVLAAEGWNNVNGLLSDAAADNSTIGRTVRRTTKKHTVNGEVLLGPSSDEELRSDKDDIIVLASGNLGLLSFPDIDGRASRQQIENSHPGLIEGLRLHEGIGLVLVRDEQLGDLVFGPTGAYRLANDTIEGDNPLLPFGLHTADHLRRTSSFNNCPDLLVNSFYDPVKDEGAAFEELIGFHGGLGGKQCHPFVLAPSQLTQPTDPLVGALSIHDLFKSWLEEVKENP